GYHYAGDERHRGHPRDYQAEITRSGAGVHHARVQKFGVHRTRCGRARVRAEVTCGQGFARSAGSAVEWRDLLWARPWEIRKGKRRNWQPRLEFPREF